VDIRGGCYDSNNNQNQKLSMPLDLLGKLLFPRMQPWQRRREAKTILITLLVAVTFAAVVAAVMLLRDSGRR